jgi:hypothetical protein
MATTALERRLADIEKTLITHDGALRDIYDKLRPAPEPSKRRIGFGTDND